MRRAVLAGLLTIVLTGCSQLPTGEASASMGSEAATATAAAPSTTPQPTSLDVATPDPSPTTSLATPTELVSLPDGLNAFSWARTHLVMDPTGEAASTTVSIGRLGSTASFVASVPRTDGYVQTLAEGPFVAVLVGSTDGATIDVHDAGDGSIVGHAVFAGWVSGFALDPEGREIYASTQSGAGDVEIHRVRFDGAEAVTLLRFHVGEAGNVPDDPYGFALTPSGSLVAIACTLAASCRFWVAPPDQDVGPAIPLATGVPRICWVVDASDDWLLVEDIDTCGADTGDASLPLRAISLEDGSSHLLNEGPNLLPGRLAEVNGRAMVLASTRALDWSTSDVVALAVDGGDRQTMLSALPNDPDSLTGWFGVDRQRLVDPWVLVERWGIDPASDREPANARLLNIATRRVIELASGTFGWR
jgi:hypothetical protein